MCKQAVEPKSEKIPEIINSDRLIKYLKWILLAAFIVIAIVFYLYFCNFNEFCSFNNNQSISNADWGTFGDFIGGTLNPILSFLSLIALLFTIVLQSQELEATRIELTRSASAQESTKQILEEQSNTLARQQFENTFFSLLDQHNKILENLSSIAIGDNQSRIEILGQFIFNGEGRKDLASAKMALEKKSGLCGHYFRVLYQLLKFIATNSPNSTIGQAFEADKIQHEKLSDDEEMYSSIVRAFLSYGTTQLLSINCCTDSTNIYWRYKLLIERYAFLEYMSFDNNGREYESLVETISFYEPSAFGNSEFVKNFHNQQHE